MARILQRCAQVSSARQRFLKGTTTNLPLQSKPPKEYHGVQVTDLSLPVALCEPVTDMQRRGDFLEYVELLHDVRPRSCLKIVGTSCSAEEMTWEWHLSMVVSSDDLLSIRKPVCGSFSAVSRWHLGCHQRHDTARYLASLMGQCRLQSCQEGAWRGC